MTKVHVTLKEAVREDLAAKTAARRLIVEQIGMRGLNVKRFERYGILTGEVEDAALPRIAGLDQVESVEPDRERHVL